MRNRHKTTAAALVLTAMLAATPSYGICFDVYRACLADCDDEPALDRFACIAECQTALSMCMDFEQMFPLIDPRDLGVDYSGLIGAWNPGDPIPFGVLPLKTTEPIQGGLPDQGNTDAGITQYLSKNAGPTPGPASTVQVRALPIDAPLNPGTPTDASPAVTDPLWNSAVVVYSGGLNGTLNTSSLAPGEYLLRVAVTDGAQTYLGMSFLNLVRPFPAASTWTIVALSTLMIAAGAYALARRSKGMQFSPRG